MKKRRLLATALVVMGFLLLVPWTIEAGGARRGGSFFLSAGDLFIGSGDFGYRHGGAGLFFAGPRLSLGVVSPVYRRHFRTDYGPFWSPYRGYSRHDYTYHRPFRRHYWYDRSSRYRGGTGLMILGGGSGISLSIDSSVRTLPHTSRIWVPGRMTDQGFRRGYWEYRTLGASEAGEPPY